MAGKGRAPGAKVSVLSEVYERLKSSVMMGEFEPGQKIRLDETARRFDVSHMPVRESLNRLVVLGALEKPPNRSVRVPDFSARRLDELMTIRIALEGRAVRDAAERASSADIALLTGLRAEMDRVLRAPELDVKRYLRMNYHFHFALYRVAENEQLLEMIEAAWLRYGPMLGLLGSGRTLEGGHRDHLEMIEGLREGDADRVALALEKDLATAAQAIRHGYDKAIAA